MKVIVTSHKELKYRGVMYKPGEEFEADPRDAKWLSSLTKLKNEDDPTLDAPRKRLYKRRDMTAEGERSGSLKFQQPPPEPDQPGDTSVEPMTTRDFPSER